MHVNRMSLDGDKQPDKSTLFCVYSSSDCTEGRCPFYDAARNRCLKAEAELKAAGLDPVRTETREVDATSEYDQCCKDLKEFLISAYNDKEAAAIVELALPSMMDIFRAGEKYTGELADPGGFLKEMRRIAPEKVDNTPLFVCERDSAGRHKMLRDCRKCSECLHKYNLCGYKIREEITKYMSSDDYFQYLLRCNPELIGGYQCADWGKKFDHKPLGCCDRCGSPAVYETSKTRIVQGDMGRYFVADDYGDDADNYFNFKYCVGATNHHGQNDRRCTVGVTEDGTISLNYTSPDGYKWCEEIRDSILAVDLADTDFAGDLRTLCLYLESVANNTFKSYGVSGQYIYGSGFMLLTGWGSEKAIQLLEDAVIARYDLYVYVKDSMLHLASKKPRGGRKLNDAASKEAVMSLLNKYNKYNKL